MIIQLANQLVWAVDGCNERKFVDCVAEVVRLSTLCVTQAHSGRLDYSNLSIAIDNLAHSLCQYIAGDDTSPIPEVFRVPPDLKTIAEFVDLYADDFLNESKSANPMIPRDFGRWSAAIVIYVYACNHSDRYALMSSILLHFVYAVLSSYSTTNAIQIIQSLAKVCLVIDGLQSFDWTN